MGFTVTVKLCAVPGQPLAKGVTKKVAVATTLDVLVPVKEDIFPVPLAPRPMPVLLLFQLNDVPGTVPVKLIDAVDAPLQTAWLETGVTFGAGLTVILKVSAAPGQLPREGVTVNTAVVTTLEVFTPVKEPIFPVPLDPSPMDGVLFVHVYVVPDTPPVKFTAIVDDPPHSDWLEGVTTDGTGSTVILKLRGVPAQPLAEGVTVTVEVTTTDEVFVAMKEAILPEPLAPSPMPELLFVQLKVVPGTAPAKLTAVVEAPWHTV